MYKAPSTEIFNEMKQAAKTVWSSYDNTHGYVTEKHESIDRLENIGDNTMVFYRMFDTWNQTSMLALLSIESQLYISNCQNIELSELLIN